MVIERIFLDRSTLVEAWHVARQRNAIKNPNTNRQVSTRPGWEIHWDGLRAEIAVCQYIGRSDLINQSIQMNGDGGSDLHIGKNSVQVKSSTYSPPYLRFDIEGSQRFTADIAILAHLPLAPKVPDQDWCKTKNWVDLYGWTPRSKFLLLAERHDFGHGERLVMKDGLEPMRDLMRSLLAGFTGVDRGHFVHYCSCGEWACYGLDDSTWSCGACLKTKNFSDSPL